MSSNQTYAVQLLLCRYVERQWINKSSFGAAWMSVRDNSMCTKSNAVESFHAALRRRGKVAHPDLYTFLGHLHSATANCETDVARLNRGMSIRRSKKRTNLVNETRNDFFRFILITLIIILPTCVSSLVLLQIATSVKILRNSYIKTAESIRHTYRKHINKYKTNSATVTHDSVE